MLDFLIAVVIIVMLVVFPSVVYVAVSQYKLGHRMGDWWFTRNHTFPDKAKSDDTRKIAIDKHDKE